MSDVVFPELIKTVVCRSAVKVALRAYTIVSFKNAAPQILRTRKNSMLMGANIRTENPFPIWNAPRAAPAQRIAPAVFTSPGLFFDDFSSCTAQGRSAFSM